MEMMGNIEEKTNIDIDEDALISSPLGVRKMHTFQHIGSWAALAQSYSPRREHSKLLMSIHVVIINAKINMLLPFGPLAIMLHYLTGQHIMSIHVVIINAKINMLLPFGPLAIMLHYLTGQHGWVFIFSLIGITPLAERLGYVTEQLTCYTGPTVGGLLNATFGNATEMIISIYALKRGMIRVVQQSLLGSVLSNMLLVLGCAFFTGGIVHCNKDQVFNKATAVVNSGLLLMAVMGLTFPAVLHFTHSEAQYGKSEVSLSRFSSCVMLVAYASYLFYQLKGQPNLYSPIAEEEEHSKDDSDEEEPEITEWEAISWLIVLTIWVSILSEYLVNAIEPVDQSYVTSHCKQSNFISERKFVDIKMLIGDDALQESPLLIDISAFNLRALLRKYTIIWILCTELSLGASESLNMPIAFISVILLPIVGNAAEHASAIMFAMKDKLDITLGVAIGSSTQISMFVVPFCVVVGWIMGKQMDLNFQLFETASLFITVLVVAFMLQDGTANYLKGLMLILCYLIVAASFFVHIDPAADDN